MQPRLSTRYLGVIMLAATLAAGRVGAQDATQDRYGLGISGFGGYITANASVFMGVEGFVRVLEGTYWSARIDGAYYRALTPPENIGCVTPSPAPACDTRQLGSLGTLIATFTAGSSDANGLRHIYLLAGAGVAVTFWGSGEDIPASNSGLPIQQGTGAGPTVAIVQAGIGSEFRLLGGNRIELRIDKVSPAPTVQSGPLGSNTGRSFSVTIGRVW